MQKKTNRYILVGASLAVILGGACASAPSPGDRESGWAIAAAHAMPGNRPNGPRIEELTGLKGQMDEAEGVFIVRYARNDLKIEAAGVRMTPPMGLTAWAAFTRAGHGTMVMGDIVLTEEQVAPVMDAALANGLAVTALHNHFFGDTPKVMFMHIGGMGDEATIASAVGKVFAALKATADGKATFPRAAIDGSQSAIDPAPIVEGVGATGTLANGIYKITIGRKTKMAGHEMGKAMGVNTWAAFTGRDDHAVVDGDFAMREDELQGVLKALRAHGIYVVAIHNHMTEESPRIIFLHYWGVGRASDLARGVRAGLDATAAGPKGE